MKIDTIRGKLAASQKLFEALDNEGDALESTHIVEHHFIANGSKKLEQLLEMAEFLGYGRTKIQEGNSHETGKYHYCDVLSRIPILAEDYDVFVMPAREALVMLSLAEAFESEYDGWGTKVLPKKDSPSGKEQ